MQTCRASSGFKNSAVVTAMFNDYVASLPRKNLTAANSKRLSEYEAVRDMAWDASYVGSTGVARAINNALRGVAGSRMLKQAERDMVAPQPEVASTSWSSDGGQRQRGSAPSRGGSSSQGRGGRPRVVNAVKACYGCGENGHVRQDCPKNKLT